MSNNYKENNNTENPRLVIKRMPRFNIFNTLNQGISRSLRLVSENHS